jgi:acetolactate synthase-1/2/3 large subunit
VYRIPPAKLIHIDLDPHEIGKNYPVEVGIVADAKVALGQLAAALTDGKQSTDYRERPFYKEIQRAREDFMNAFKDLREANGTPISISRALAEMRPVTPRDSIWVTGAGNPQTQVHQEVPFYGPRTHITSGGFSTMGFTVPGAIGAQLAAPKRRVIGVSGDGDFLNNMQELGIAVQKSLPIVFVIMNNASWQSIENLQATAYGGERKINTRFMTRDGRNYTPKFVDIARGFGARTALVETPDQVGPALRDALDSGETSVIEIPCAKELPYSGIKKYAWWDVPVPEYLSDLRKEYEKAREAEAV